MTENLVYIRVRLKFMCKFAGMGLGVMDLMIQSILVGVMTQRVA